MNSPPAVTVLLIEDDPDDARIVERLLLEYAPAGTERPGGKVEIESIEYADRLHDGLATISGTSIDLVLLDLELPDSSGVDTIEAMTQRVPSIPIVVLTGRTDVGVEAIQRGAQDYLVKGRLTAELLFKTIRYAIERSEISRELRDRKHRLVLTNEILRSNLRNDLSIVVGLADQLRNSDDPVDQDIVEPLLKASRHALELSDTTAELVDIITGDVTVEPTPTDLSTIVEAELDRIRHENDVELSIKWNDTPSTPIPVAGTPILGSVFEHVFSNAATHRNGDIARIAVTVEATDDTASVSIADDGVGIPDERKEAILDPEVGNQASAGAGLYFVRTVLERIGGDLDITDNDPRGTVVTITLDRIE
ncbi:hybrid sensor histidine kinase/response regulator [Natrinema halophilum]|uniref:hybrid sensor histidine kinase/response regulator n=1 Tax=Natrinema halophilum TaxID=1699371 RepID=UPI001F40DD05|nr:hybrid sensor histidine kinase/response regulator [Natrinema halophilum]UHQ96242.1 hybrid sensor histidine kinase/response regulator [Natrinema halophilum]